MNVKRWLLLFGLVLTLPESACAAAAAAEAPLPLPWVIPFVGILLSIALLPLIAPHFWHHHFGKVAAAWATLFIVPYAITHGLLDTYDQIAHVYVLEFIPFLILLWALFTIAGGIRVRGYLRGSPKVNIAILGIGVVLASIMGTTGAAMLLIRPLLRANAWRQRRAHVVVFFIFLVANIGGSLTPLGDPPLFLGFLKGVSFFWTTEHLFLPMVLATVWLLAVFFVLDRYLIAREPAPPPDDGTAEPLGLEGRQNFLFLGGVVLAILLAGSFQHHALFWNESAMQPYASQRAEAEAKVTERRRIVDEVAEAERPEAVRQLLLARAHVNELREGAEHAAVRGIKVGPHVTLPSINILRDALILGMGALSLMSTPTIVRRKNDFSWFPILEVAKLFAAIFVTIIPAIAILKAGPEGALSGVVMAVTSPSGDPVNAMYFWLTGGLSSFLDNAPTYLVFFNTAGGNAAWLMGEGSATLLAISLGAVFMGAMTYIGNAPNFMVRSIAEESGVKMPSFFGYLARWSLPFLLPLFAVLTLIWF